MPYNITLSNGNNLVSIPDYSLDNTTSLTLLGYGTSRIGETLANNQVHMLENFANTSAPVNPLTGQLWYNSTNQLLYVYNGSLWVSISTSGSIDVIPLNANTARPLSNLFSDVYSIEDFGVVNDPTGIHIAANTIAYQNALNTSAGLARLLHKAELTVYHTGLTIPANTQWELNGTIILAPNANNPCLTVPNSNWTLTGIGVIDGNKTNNSSGTYGGAGIWTPNNAAGGTILTSIPAPSNVYISGITIQNCVNWPVCIANTTNCIIERCTFLNSGSAPRFVNNCVNCHARFNVINGISDYAFAIYQGGSFCSITDNYAINSSCFSILTDSSSTNVAHDCIIARNKIIGTINSQGILVNNTTPTITFYNILIEENYLENCNETLTNQPFVIQINGNCILSKIIGNYITGGGPNSSSANAIAVSGTICSFIDIEENTIYNFGTVSGAYAISLDSTTLNSIRIIGNRGVDDRTTPFMIGGIYLNGGTNNEVVDNHFDTLTTPQNISNQTNLINHSLVSGIETIHNILDVQTLEGDVSSASVQIVGSNSSRSLKNISFDNPSVLSYGVVNDITGSNVSTNTTDLQTGLTAVAGNTNITLPFSTTVIIDASVNLPVYGRFTLDGTLKLAANANNSVLQINSNTIVEGMGIIDGNKANNASSPANVANIFGNNVTNVVLRDLTVQNSFGWSWNIVGYSGSIVSNVLIDNLTSIGSGDAPEFSNANNVWGYRCNILTGHDIGFCLYGNVANSGINDSYFYGNLGFASVGSLSDSGQPISNNNIMISRNIIIDSAEIGVSHSSSSANSHTNIITSYNIINGASVAAINYGNVIDGDISYNYVYGPTTANILVQGTSQNIRTVGNNIHNVTGSAITYDAEGGLIDGNFIYDSQSTATLITGINITGTSATNPPILGLNYFSASVSNPVNIPASTFKSIFGFYGETSPAVPTFYQPTSTKISGWANAGLGIGYNNGSVQLVAGNDGNSGGYQFYIANNSGSLTTTSPIFQVNPTGNVKSAPDIEAAVYETSPTNGSTFVIPSQIQYAIVNGTSTLSSLTIGTLSTPSLPTNTVTTLTILFNIAVNNLSWITTVSGASLPTSAVAGSVVELIWQEAQSSWFNSTSNATPNILIAAGTYNSFVVNSNGVITSASTISSTTSVTLLGDVSGFGVGSVNTTLAVTGVSAGTYNTVVVDVKGRVLLGSNVSVVNSFNTRSGAITLTNSDVVSALGFTPISSSPTITVSGDVSGSGSTSLVLTLNSSGVTPGTYNSVVVNSKGLVTAATNSASDVAVTLTGDITGSGVGTVVTTLAASGVNAGTYNFLTVNTKGIITAATNIGYYQSGDSINVGAITSVGQALFSANSFSDPQIGTTRDAKFGDLGIAVKGGIYTDTLNVTSNSSFNVRPIFNSATPWDSANLINPITTSGGTFNGTVSFSNSLTNVSNYNNVGLTVGWNYTNGGGEVDLMLGPGGGPGGIKLYQLNQTGQLTNTTPIFQVSGTGVASVASDMYVGGNVNVYGTTNSSVSNFNCHFNGNSGYQLVIAGNGTNPTPQILLSYSGVSNKYIRIDSGGSLGIVNNAYTAQILTLEDNGSLTINGTMIATNFVANNGGEIYVNNGAIINGGFITNYSNYTYMTASVQGHIAGNSTNVPVGLQVANRLLCLSEIDCTSDLRLKSNVQNISSQEGLDFLYQNKPKTFIWNEKSNQNGVFSAGYIAQNFAKNKYGHLLNIHDREGLEKHVDENGFESPENAEFSINYNGTIPYLHAALLAAFEKINELTEEINKLK